MSRGLIYVCARAAPYLVDDPLPPTEGLWGIIVDVCESAWRRCDRVAKEGKERGDWSV